MWDITQLAIDDPTICWVLRKSRARASVALKTLGHGRRKSLVASSWTANTPIHFFGSKNKPKAD